MRKFPYIKKNIEYNQLELIKSNFLDNIYDKDLDYIIIKNVLDKKQLEFIRNCVQEVQELFEEVFPGFKSLPPPLSSNLKDGILDMKKLSQQQFNLFQSFAKKTNNVLYNSINQSISNLCLGNLSYKTDFEDVTLVPGSLRVLSPQMGDLLSLHCGNEFCIKFNVLYKVFDKYIDYKNQLSYFLLLRKPQTGGEISLYNFTWDKVNKKTNNYTIVKDGKEVNIDSAQVKKLKLNLEEGDMFIFAGGEIWHRVEEHLGGERITYGGFIGKVKNEDKYILWS